MQNYRPPSDDELARARLRLEFPHVPRRIIIDVFAAYRRQTETADAALTAARQRLVDACALS